METTNSQLSIIAFYLSEYDADAVHALGFRTRQEAFDAISARFGKNNSFLKRRRDEYDALPDSASHRIGYQNRTPARIVQETAAYLHRFSFEELTGLVQSLIQDPEDGSLLDTNDTQVSMEHMDEEEIERIANITDPSAKLVFRTIEGNQRVYNTRIIKQLKMLYLGRCQICGENPVSSFGVNICEAHHIAAFSVSKNNDASNIIILCPNHHRLIHQLAPVFDDENLRFVMDDNSMLPVVLDYHLKRD